MKSLHNSTKSELLEQLLNSVDEEFGGVKLPPEERTFIVWDNDGLEEQKVKEREEMLMKKYGTLEGFDPMIIRWGSQKNDQGQTKRTDSELRGNMTAAT